MKPTVEVSIESPLWSAEPRAEATVNAEIAAAAEMASTAGGELSIVLTDDSHMQELNRTWRGLDKPTNVLSFPAPSGVAGGMLGDIVIAYETLARECGEEHKPFLHHLAHLAVHGFLHIAGYDHETDAEATEMEGLETRILHALDVPDPYFARELE